MNNPIQNSPEELYEKLINTVDDVNRSGLADTPKRAAKAFEFLTSGYNENLDEQINDALFDSDCDDIVIVKNIELYSLCEHHLLPFLGHCHIGYIPNKKVLGLSKFARIVDHYSHRLQIQENLGAQIADSITHYTDAVDVAVIIEAKHLCTMMRGVEKQNSTMKTSTLRGEFRDSAECRNELLQLIKL
jgi:GTP cyclohydrolase IA